MRHWLKMFQTAKTWQLALLLVLCLFIAATFLRLNNLGMVERREAVIAADKTGDKAVIRQTLAELQHYTSGHMNAEPGPLYLQESFNRDYAAAISAAASQRNSSSDVYQQAAIACQARFQGGTASFRNDYVACVAAAVGNLTPQQQQTVSLPVPSTYRYSFSSPLISFDLAGIGCMLSLFLAAVISLKIIGVVSLRLLIKRRQNVF